MADLVPAHTTVRRHLPVTNPLRTIVSGLAWPSLFSIAAIEAMRDEVARRGRAGVGVLAAILEQRALGDAVSDSKLESRMAKLLQRAGLPAAVFHFVVSTPSGVFLAEVDGFGVHGTPRAMAKDFVRQNGLVPYGWHVLRFTWRQVVREPEMVARTIAGALAGLAAA